MSIASSPNSRPRRIQKLWLRTLGWATLVVVALIGAILLIDWINDVRYEVTIAPLKSDDEASREQAIRSLPNEGPEAVTDLARALRDHPDPRVREGTARALGKFDKSTIEAAYDPAPDLENATVNDADATVRKSARAAIDSLKGR